MATDFDRYTRGLKPTGDCSPRVKKHWALLVQMQKLIDLSNLTPNKAAHILAKDHWRSAWNSEYACVHWFKHNQRRFHGELRLAFSGAFVQSRQRRFFPAGSRGFSRSSRALPSSSRCSRVFCQKRDRDHPQEAAQRLGAGEEAARKIESWHERFRHDPKGALRQMLEDIKRDEESFDH